jgi:hypothetical protein
MAAGVTLRSNDPAAGEGGMDNPASKAPGPMRGAAAVFAGFLVVAGLSLGTDQLMHVLDVYPPWNEPMHETSDNLLALAYRVVYAILGGIVTAKLAPRAPMRYVRILAIIGTVLATLGAVGAIAMDVGPAWYPIALAISAYPTTWLGGRLVSGPA